MAAKTCARVIPTSAGTARGPWATVVVVVLDVVVVDVPDGTVVVVVDVAGGVGPFEVSNVTIAPEGTDGGLVIPCH
jgi:hypothetical protein